MSDLPTRYSRQILFAEIGTAGQERLLGSRVVIVGCGALGTVQAEALTRAGVGSLRLIDRDFIEESNLQRQTLFTEEDVREGLPKAVAARRHLQAINSSVAVEARVEDLNYRNAESLLEDADCILDGTDNFEARFLLNDVSHKRRIPWIYGAAVGSEGLTMTIVPGRTPCLRCVFESPPPPGTTPTCDTAGVLAPAVNLVASLQVAEALKILTGRLDRVNRSLVSLDVWRNSWRRLEIESSRTGGDCPACHLGRYDFLEGERESLATVLCGRDSVQISQAPGKHLDFPQLSRRLEPLGSVSYNRFLLRFRLKEIEIAVFPDGRSIVKGTRDSQEARSLYSRYIGN